MCAAVATCNNATLQHTHIYTHAQLRACCGVTRTRTRPTPGPATTVHSPDSTARVPSPRTGARSRADTGNVRVTESPGARCTRSKPTSNFSGLPPCPGVGGTRNASTTSSPATRPVLVTVTVMSATGGAWNGSGLRSCANRGCAERRARCHKKRRVVERGVGDAGAKLVHGSACVCVWGGGRQNSESIARERVLYAAAAAAHAHACLCRTGMCVTRVPGARVRAHPHIENGDRCERLCACAPVVDVHAAPSRPQGQGRKRRGSVSCVRTPGYIVYGSRPPGLLSPNIVRAFASPPDWPGYLPPLPSRTTHPPPPLT